MVGFPLRNAMQWGWAVAGSRSRWSSGSRTAIFLGGRIDGVTLAQTRPRQLDAVGAVHDAVHNGVADRRVGDEFVPALYGNLAGHQQRTFLVTVLDDLQHVAPLLGGQRLRTPVVDDQQPGALQCCQHAWQPALAT